MKKKLICLTTVIVFLLQLYSCVFAQNNYLSNDLKIAIKKYKTGNYTGCLQDCQNIIKNNPSNPIANYYLAISYVQTGKKDKAIEFYSKVLKLNSGPRLVDYASTGKKCLETPEQCSFNSGSLNQADISELDKFIASPPIDGLSQSVRQDFRQRRLDNLRYDINKDRELDDYSFKKFKDYSRQKSMDLQDNIKIAQNKPSEKEIQQALQVLNDAGINYSTSPMEHDNSNIKNINYQNQELMQLKALMGNNNQSQESNAMLNMLPFMLTQNKDGKNNYSPQVMQAIIMNSMMPDLNYDLDTDK